MFAIAGGKGGCGKSTAALGIGRALARMGREPLVVDADRELPNLHLLAEVPGEPSAADLAERPLEGVVHRAETVPGVAILPAGDGEPTGALLREAAGWDGPVVLDCPAGAGPDATAPLRHSQGSILVTTDDRRSIRDTAKTAGIARRVGAEPVAALVRTREGRPVTQLDVPRTERVPEFDAGAASEGVLGRPRFRAGCRALAGAIDRAASDARQKTGRHEAE